MKPKWMLCAFIVLFTLIEIADSYASHYMTKNVCITRYKRQRDVRRCGSRRFCCYYVNVPYLYCYIKRVCKPGWGSCYCHIPICDKVKCVYGRGTCVAPNTCKCSHPSYAGRRCDQYQCTSLQDCYPGMCAVFNPSPPVCVCHNGFTGTNCETMEVGPSIDKCSVTLRNIHQNKVRNTIKVNCNMDDITTNDEATTVYVNDRDLTQIQLNWTASFEEPPGAPAQPSYVTAFEVGLVAARTNVTLENADGTKLETSPYSCDKLFSNGNLVDTVSCSKIHKIDKTRVAVNEGYRYNVSFGATSGGYKRVNGRTKDYRTVSFTKELIVIFDVEKPFHCTTYDKCINDNYTNLTTPVAFGLSEDITKNEVTFIIMGWNDLLSGVDHFEYNSMIMAPDNSGNLSENSLSLATQTWRYGEGVLGIPTYTPEKPGMYSIVLSVFDNASNFAQARTLLLYDPDSEVTVNPLGTFRADEASADSNYTWITEYTTGGPLSITMNWTEHFENKFHHENGLLRSVRPAVDENPSDTGIIDDDEGNRTVDGIDNARGIIQFKIAYRKDTLMNNLKNPPNQMLEMPQLRQTFKADFPVVNDGETIMFWITAIDVLGNELTDTYMVRLDNSEPVLGTPTTKVNVFNESETVPLATRITFPAWDHHSGIGIIRYTLRDQTEGGTEVYRGEAEGIMASFMDEDTCRQNKDSCTYCIPSGQCFDENNLIYIDHCKILERQGHTFSLDMVVGNQADLQERKMILKMGELSNLIGIGNFPSVVDINIFNVTDSSFVVSWNFYPSCYTRLNVILEYEESGKAHKKEIDGSRRTFTVSSLPSGTRIDIRITVRYEEGQSDAVVGDEAVVDATTSGGGGGLSAGAIAGIVIVVLLLLIIILILLFCLLYRRRYNKFPSVPFINIFMNNEKQDHTSNLNSNILNKAGSNAYTSSTKEVKQMSNPAYFDGEDDIYTYDNADMKGTFVHKVDPRNITYGDTICDGKFADIVLANVKEKNGSVIPVAAKKLKANHDDGDVIQMRAKKNFYVKAVTPGDYILNMYGVIEEGPVLLLEYCEAGSLKDWFSQTGSHITPSVLEQMNVFCLHVSKGVEQLHDSDIIHGRLAARNILLTNIAGELHAKVAGFGPRPGEKFEQDHVRDNTKKAKIPAKWLSMELLAVEKESQRNYTKHSDVWSYGIVVWEIYSLGAVPYDVKTRHELHELLLNGYRLPRPEYASDAIYQDVMLSCWDAKPFNRPIMETYTTYFEEMLYKVNADDEYYEGRG